MPVSPHLRDGQQVVAVFGPHQATVLMAMCDCPCLRARAWCCVQHEARCCSSHDVALSHPVDPVHPVSRTAEEDGINRMTGSCITPLAALSNPARRPRQRSAPSDHRSM